MPKQSTSQKLPLPEAARGRAGRPSSYKPEYVNMAKQAAKLGATDADLARIFGVSDATVDNWKTQHPDFLGSLKAGKEEADARVERALYQRANEYSYDAEKIFCDKNGKITKVPYRVHVPPDVTAQIFWLKNRKPSEWRDAWQLEATLGKYIISDKPMTEEEWIAARADVIDVTPEKPEE
jgi:transposase-like protein